MRDLVVNPSDIIEVIERSLKEYYLIDMQKFNVRELVRSGRVSQELLNKLENVIQKKLITKGTRIENITIDFGKYPL